MAAFDNFFDYEGEYPYLQDHFADAWAAVVTRFKDHPAVIGYDILNEPSPGSVYDSKDISLTPAGRRRRGVRSDTLHRVLRADDRRHS